MANGNRFSARLRFGLFAVMGAGLSALLPHAPAGSEPALAHKASMLSPVCRLMKIDSVDLQDGGRRGWYLYVGGMRRFANMEVGVEAGASNGGTLTLQVVGCTPNFIALPIPTPYNLELRLRDFQQARQIKLVGANGYVLQPVPGR